MESNTNQSEKSHIAYLNNGENTKGLMIFAFGIRSPFFSEFKFRSDDDKIIKGKEIDYVKTKNGKILSHRKIQLIQYSLLTLEIAFFAGIVHWIL